MICVNVFFKYQDYCKASNLCDFFFQVTQKEDETLEYYVELFQYNLQRSKKNKIYSYTL
jgi:hypothetical protein